MSGVEELSQSGELKNRYEFYGEKSEDRNKATGEVRAVQGFRIFVIKFLTTVGLKPFLSKKIKEGKRKIKGSDLVVFQGFQEIYLTKYARKIGKRIAYMPHSPSIMADEYKMLCALNFTKFSENEYQNFCRIESDFIKLSDFVVFPSKGASTEYFKKFSNKLFGKKIYYIQSGIKSFGRPSDIKKNISNRDSLRIIFAGRYVHHKGYDLFCSAAELVVPHRYGVEFLTLGDGPMKKSYQYITNLGWRDDVFKVLDTADIVVVPNRIAYYDLLPLECAALGKPLVMTSVGGNVDQMHELPDTLSCDSLTPEALAESINAAIEKLKLDPAWGEGNLLAFNSTFTVKKFAERWDVAVEDMLNSK
jgi:glycosyltransferase involved in cell wall biosynthesis